MKDFAYLCSLQFQIKIRKIFHFYGEFSYFYDSKYLDYLKVTSL